MKTYKVKTTCTFQNRYLDAGKIVQYEDDVKVPRHLALVKGKVKPDAIKDGDGSLSEMQKDQQKLNNPSSGFAKNAIEKPEKSEKSEKSTSKKEEKV